MRDLTPETPGTRSLVSPTKQQKEEVADLPSASKTMPTPATTPTPVRTATAMPQRRRRTIRTYGKKRQYSDDAEEDAQPLQSKRQRTGDISASQQPVTQTPNTELISADKEPRDDENTSAVCLPSPVERTPKKRTGILRYFQPAAVLRSSPSSSGSSCHSSSPPIKPIRDAGDIEPLMSEITLPSSSSPPSSPPAAIRQRQKRRLTIRPDHSKATKSGQNVENEHIQPQEEDDEEEYTNWRSSASSMAASSSRMRLRLGLNQGQKQDATSSATRKKKAPAQPSVQTTLSLAMGADAFKECKECNILYNPLHEKDAKFHARYHASMSRKQRRKDKAGTIALET